MNRPREQVAVHEARQRRCLGVRGSRLHAALRGELLESLHSSAENGHEESEGIMGTLFEEMCIGSLRARNRLVRAATYEGLATDDGHLTPELAAVCEELAAGGAGTVILGYAYVTPDEQPNPRMLGIYDDSFVPEYRELVERLHSYDARVVSQIVYGGSATKLDPPSARILGPSAVPNPKTGIVPVEASRGDIRLLVESFAAAARRARDAGFDGVELHAAHGYLLSQFLNPLLNRRTDEYGGPVRTARASSWRRSRPSGGRQARNFPCS